MTYVNEAISGKYYDHLWFRAEPKTYPGGRGLVVMNPKSDLGFCRSESLFVRRNAEHDGYECLRCILWFFF